MKIILFLVPLLLVLANFAYAQEPEVCSQDAELVDGICQMKIVQDAPHEVDGTILGVFFILFVVIIFGIIVLIVWKLKLL